MALRAQRPKLKKLLAEASEALARLDVDRLEEMAHSCEALISFPGPPAPSGDVNIQQELSTFKRVLEATRANLSILRNLRDRKPAQLEYAPMTAVAGARTEGRNGND